MSAIVQCEVVMAEGRTDMVMRLGDRVFVCEFKVSATAKTAINQIDRKKYYEPWRAVQRRIIKVGAYFDVAERTLKDWKFEEVE